MLGRTPVPPLALAGRHACRCRWLPRSSSSSGGGRGGDGGGNQRGYHATAVRREALSTADMVAWHDGASVVESVTPNGLIGVNGVMIQGSVMVLPRLCLLWHVKGLEVRACRAVSSHVVTCGGTCASPSRTVCVLTTLHGCCVRCAGRAAGSERE